MFQTPDMPDDQPPEDDAQQAPIIRLAVLAAIGGALAGLVGGVFRRALDAVAARQVELLEWARDEPALYWLVPIALAALAVAIARLVTRIVPDAQGSGIQHVEASMHHERDFGRFRLLPAKFASGLLALGAGLVLGREGPTVQMGAVIGSEIGRLGRVGDHDRRTLMASLAGAGLGVAFSAPLGGAVFVFEELARAVRTRLVVTTVVGSGVAVGVAYRLVGRDPIFSIPTVSAVPLWTLAAFALLGLLMGLLGIAYSRLILLLLDLSARWPGIPVEAKAGAIGALIGAIGIIDPELIGGGTELNELVLVTRYSLLGLVGLLAVRWLLGPLSYATGTAGGLFSPLLVVGAIVGVTIAEAANAVAPDLGLSTLAFGIVGMSTFFAAVVRAPVTGVILIVEMTATTSLMAPMLIAAGAAVGLATLLKAPPIYDSLRERGDARRI